MAMAFGVTGLKVPRIVIKDPGCTAKRTLTKETSCA